MVQKVLIVDDEYPARQELRYLLEQFNNIEIVGEAAGASEALKLIQALEYDILFLDINLPGKSGLELASNLQTLSQKPHVIFTTAYENHALEAFEVNADDYILKPICKARLKQAIDKVAVSKSKENGVCNTDEEIAGAPACLDKASSVSAESGDLMAGRIIAEYKGKMVLADIDEICFAYIEGDVVFVKTFGEKMLTRFTLKELEARLNKSNFFRTHRSYIVNIRKVKEILPFFNGTYLLVMDDKEKSEVPVSRNQARKLRKLLGY